MKEGKTHLDSKTTIALLQTSEHRWRENFPHLTRDEFRELKRKAREDEMKENPARSLARDRKLAKVEEDKKALSKKLTQAIKELADKDKKLEGFKSIGKPHPHVITPKKGDGQDEATAVWLASDWHVEEVVKAEMVNGLNAYTPDVAKARAEAYFRNALRLTDLVAKDVPLKTIVLGLLGDFFSNDIHDELAEVNAMGPTKAVRFAQNLIASGIKYVLANSPYDLVIVCASGNHARDTKKVHISTESDHSFEWLMYQNLAELFANEPRVKFIISEAYLTYVQVYDKTLAFHHGHQVRYAGGVGGLYIPMNKAIGQWNKMKMADLYLCGHFHSQKDGGNFVTNGSLIGFNAYAVSIKADYERPQQTFLVINKKRGRTWTAPILVE